MKLVVESVVPLELSDNRLLQFRGAADLSVFGESVFCCLDGRLFDVIRCVEIRFTGTKADNILTGSAYLCGTCADSECGGLPD